MPRWPVTPKGRSAQAKLIADGLCYVEPTPVLAILDEMRTIRMSSEHPADVQASRQGDAIGWWEGDTLVIDTVAFEPNPSGLGLNVPSSAGKHTVERLTLTDDRLRLRCRTTVEDPVYLSEPATLTQQWDHRPDLQFSPPWQACEDDVAARYHDGVPD